MPTTTVLSLCFYKRGSIVVIDDSETPYMVKEVYVKVDNDSSGVRVGYFVLQEDGLRGRMVEHGDPELRDVSHHYEDGSFARVSATVRNKQQHPLYAERPARAPTGDDDE